MELRIGVIGVGSMGINHVRVLSQMRDVVLVGVVDTDRQALQTAHKRYGIPVYCQIESLLEQNLDAVTIAVPTSLHRDVALPIIGSGVHVLIEKPIAKSLYEAEEIVDAAEKNNINLMIGHIERFNPIISAIKEAISGERIVSIDIKRIGPFPPRIKDVGVIIDLSVHDIDLIRVLTGAEFAEINCYISNNFSEFEDNAILTFRMTNGVVASLTTNWITPFKRRMIQIATPKKFIEGDFLTMQAREYSGSANNSGSYVVNALRTIIGEPLRFELEAFVESIKNGNAPPVTGQDGLKALEIAIKCLESGSKSLEALEYFGTSNC